jgi:hypothetical protein
MNAKRRSAKRLPICYGPDEGRRSQIARVANHFADVRKMVAAPSQARNLAQASINARKLSTPAPGVCTAGAHGGCPVRSSFRTLHATAERAFMRVVCVIRAFGMSASSLLPGLFSEDDIVARFDKGGPHSVSARMIRERARAKGLGRKFGRVRWFTEDEILQMMKAGPARLAILLRPRDRPRPKRLCKHKRNGQSECSPI